eukprot:TRINITY_DN312_c0_g1_i2.p1 TRINITY_DN312_c0_g1~~TRINITY_DN312_c0_g1_i2.p1  ORF type:complete len:164 (-),score=22.84 TRINITY_DN312_c0_g1_i2:37-528(-)
MEIDLRSHDTRCAADFCTSICHQDCNGVGFIHNCNCIVSRKGFCTKCRHSIEMHIHTGVHYYDVTKSNRTICNEKKRKLEEALANTKNEEDRQHQIVKVLEDTSKKCMSTVLDSFQRFQELCLHQNFISSKIVIAIEYDMKWVSYQTICNEEALANSKWKCKE